jgi:GTP-binding protein
MPLIAIVGRPNVGKSTLFNRITGTRRSIVGNQPGITRDRIYDRAEWQGKVFEVVDTGGMLPGEREVMPREILKHAGVAVRQAGQVVLVVDGRAEITATDRDLARLLRQTGKPLILAVNKAESRKLEAQMQEWYELGIGRVFFVSAEHSIGVAELLDEVTKDFPRHEEAPVAAATPAPDDEIRVAIIGKPNVGKSTLLNQMAGEERAIVTPLPGTTRDAVDLVIESPIAGCLRLIDTAGIRRKTKTHGMAEKLSVVMAHRNVRMCDIALLLIDATEGATSQDASIAAYTHQHGKGLIVAVNKWDLVADKRIRAGEIAGRLRREVSFIDYAPMQFLSAATGWNVDKLLRNIQEVGQARSRRIPTGELNRFFASLDLQRARLPVEKRLKIYYLTQAGVRPPTFVLFTDRREKLPPSFERYLESQVRRSFPFPGTPLVFKTRPRK